jgi:hypothetical protein
MNNSSAIPRYFNPSAIKRSTLAVILSHSMVNFTEELIALSERADGVSNSHSFSSEGDIN